MNSQDFLNSQLSFPRVKEANDLKFKKVQDLFLKKKLDFSSKIYWRAFKFNKHLELWAKPNDSSKYTLIHTYPICAIVGDLGPKRQEGDFQIPEGFYQLTNFNPNSKYHLSIKINYPNKSDSILGVQGKLGGDIYVHGFCETVGCLPMTDSLMQEIYLINLYAKSNGQDSIPIDIFPARLTLKNFNKLKGEYFKFNKPVLDFWTSMKKAFEYFEKHKKRALFTIDDKGNYIVK